MSPRTPASSPSARTRKAPERLFWLVGAGLLASAVGCGTAPDQPAKLAATAGDPARARPGEEHQLLSPNHRPVRVGQYDWPQWLGLSRDNASLEVAWRADWSANPPKVLWQKQVGAGYSAVSVCEGFAYTMGNADGKDAVWCLDAETGKEVWCFRYPCRQGMWPGPRATPNVQAGRVCTLSQEGVVYCLDARSGKPLWRQDLGGYIRYKARGWEWGVSPSPLVFGDLVVVDLGTVVAMDQQTGRVRWTSGSHETAYASPTTILRGLDVCLVVLNGWGLRVLNPLDGKEYASREWKGSGINVVTPLVAGDQVFLTTGYGMGCALMKVEGDRISEVYSSKVLSSQIHTPVLHDGHVYGFHGNVSVNAPSENVRGALKCIELATGTQKWARTGLGYGAVTKAGSRLIAMTERGLLVAVEATPDGYKELGRCQVLQGRTWTMPVLADGRIYCRNTPGDMVCLDVAAETR